MADPVGGFARVPCSTPTFGMILGSLMSTLANFPNTAARGGLLAEKLRRQIFKDGKFSRRKGHGSARQRSRKKPDGYYISLSLSQPPLRTSRRTDQLHKLMTAAVL